MPEYLPEDEEQEEEEKDGVISLFTGLRQSASSLYKSTAEFLHNSFYWWNHGVKQFCFFSS